MQTDYDIFSPEIGLNPWLFKGDVFLSSSQMPSLTEDVPVFTGGSNPIDEGIDLRDVLSGSELGAILAYGKRSFTDTANGWIQGMDTDGVYKWLIGGASSSIDWSVTTANTLSLTGSMTITGGSITIGTDPNAFHVDTNGNMWLGAATLAAAPSSITNAGLLTTTSALIGGWNIVSGYIYNLQSGTPTAVPNDGVVLASGNEALIIYEDTARRVELGYLSAGVYGLKVYATDGTTVIYETSDTQQIIAGWFFTSTVLRTGASDAASNVLIDSANSLMRLGPTTGNYITLDGANLRVRSSNYTTGVSGFTIEPTLIEAENIVARGIMRGSTFMYDVISAVGGQVIIANSDTLASDMTALDASTLTTRGTTTWAVNDIMVIRQVTALGIQEEWLRVTGIGAAPTYSVTRDLAGSFAADTNPIWQAGTTVVRQGSSDGAAAFSGGWLRLLGEGTNSPYYSVFRRTGVAYNAYSEVLRMGNLNGFLGYASAIFGFGVGSSAGTDANITIDPTNGIRIRSGTTNLITFDNSGNASFVGNVQVATGGSLSSGQTAYDTGTGYWLEYNAGTPRFSIGNSAANKMLWTGTALQVVGDLVSHSPSMFGVVGSSIGFQAATMSADGTRMLGIDGVSLILFRNYKAGNTFFRVGAGTGTTPTLYTIAFVGSTYAYGAAGAATDVYRYDNGGAGETLMTFSGTAPTNIGCVGSNDTNLFVQEGGVSGTSIYQYSISGTTLTYVSTITLDTAPTSSLAMMVNASYIFMTASDRVRNYNLSGVLQETRTFTFPVGQQLRSMSRSPSGKTFLLATQSNVANDQPAWYLFDY